MARAILRLGVLALLLGPVAALMVLTETRPLVAEQTAPTPASALATRDVVRAVRAATNTPGAASEIALTLEQMNGVIAFAARILPGLRGRAEMRPEGVRLRASLPVPGLERLGWVNVEAVVPPFEAGPTLERLRLGRLSLPPRTAVAVGVWAADWALGAEAGQRLVGAVPRMTAEPDGVRFVIAMDGTERGALTRRLARLLRGEEMPLAAEIDAHYVAFREALEAGRLEEEGSFVPYLRLALERSLTVAAPGREGHELTAALFALTRLCGARDFRLVVGRLAADALAPDHRVWTRRCRARLRGRVDLRRHFVTAAALKAASTIEVSFAIGEYKELVDVLSGAGGFDFTDIAANASGIRFAERLMAAPGEAWPELIARLSGEEAVIAGLEGIPGRLPGPEFVARFGAADSPAYRAMLAEIEARVDRLALHAEPGHGG